MHEMFSSLRETENLNGSSLAGGLIVAGRMVLKVEGELSGQNPDIQAKGVQIFSRQNIICVDRFAW